jgi:hypothetical protein
LAKPSGRTTPAACTAAYYRASIAAIPWRLAIMPNITMLDIEELRQTKLKPYIEKCLEHRAPDPGFHAMMGHNIDLCEAMFVAWDACFNKGRIAHPLKEVIRVQLSRAANCTY